MRKSGELFRRSSVKVAGVPWKDASRAVMLNTRVIGGGVVPKNGIRKLWVIGGRPAWEKVTRKASVPAGGRVPVISTRKLIRGPSKVVLGFERRSTLVELLFLERRDVTKEQQEGLRRTPLIIGNT